MEQRPAAEGRPMRRGLVWLGAIAVLAVVLPAAALLGSLVGASSRPSASVAPFSTQVAVDPTATAAPTAAPSPTAAPTPTPAPTATPIPLVPAPLTGRLVTAEEAAYRAVAVMIDDHTLARPQAGFNAASIVWHAPAEGGIPRYMLIFQETIPTDVGPIRSTRQYYVEWAAEWTPMLVHHGGSPEAQSTLDRYGQGEWVYDADGMRWEPRYVFRVHENGRFAPHNVFTDGEHLRELAQRVGAEDAAQDGAWRFVEEKPFPMRGGPGTITVDYPYERITYRYDPYGNRYLPYVNDAKQPQKDAADGLWVAPKNVVILRVRFSAIPGDRLKRLDAQNIGEGEAYIASNGVTVKGTWRKDSVTAPLLLFGPDGEPVELTVGQTFIQAVALSYDVEVDDGPSPLTRPDSTSSNGG